jgi:probable F420-dependent oxidoreductase
MDLSGIGVWSLQLRFGDQAEVGDAATELEELGFSAVWMPDPPPSILRPSAAGSVFDTAGRLLRGTQRMVVATGVLNLWMHTPADAAASYASLSSAHGDRFLLGIGVSHAAQINAEEPGRHQRPLAAMSAFLDGLDTAGRPVPAEGRVLAALGPKMLELAAKRAGGIHSYLVTPEHTRRAREVLGEGHRLFPEQAVILCAGRDEARAIGAEWLQFYANLPSYANNWLRLGFSPDDLAPVSDRLFDAMIAWGDEEAIRRRVDEHRAAGADHVAIQVLDADLFAFPRQQWRRLASALL